MITPDYVVTMAEYNAEMNRRLYTAADRLADAERRAERGAFWGSIHGTLNHLLWGDMTWMSRFDGWEKPPVSQRDSAGMVPEYEALRERRVAADARLLEWAGRTTPEWLQGELVWFSGGSQKEMRGKRDVLVMHLFNHQTHHRGQAHALLTAAGETVAATDLPWVIPPTRPH